MTKTGLGRGNARPASCWAVSFGWASVAVGWSLPGAANEQQPEPLIARMSRSWRVWRWQTPFFFFFSPLSFNRSARELLDRSCRTIHREQCANLTLPICQSKLADLKIDQGRTIRRSTENTRRDQPSNLIPHDKGHAGDP
jgi:hypothetical protein